MSDKACPLLSGVAIGDACLGGVLSISEGPVEGDRYTSIHFPDGRRTVFNSRAAAMVQAEQPPKKNRKPRSKWVTTATLAAELGCAQKHIRETLKDEVLKPGEHYRNINPTAWRPTYRWHLQKCVEAVANVTPD